MLGGAAVHFSLAASFFTEVRPVGPVGDDFGAEQFAVLERRGILTDDIERVAGGQSFFWRGRYEYDLNVAHTEDTQLGVFAEFEPKLSRRARRRPTPSSSPTSSPTCSARCAPSATGAGFSGLDSMNLWIETAKDSLQAAIAEVDCLVVNDAEIRHADRRVEPRPRRPRGDGRWARARSSPSRASTARRCSPRAASSPCPASRSRTCATRPAPATASPAASSATSTAQSGELDEAELRRAMGYGTVLASFNVEEFGTERVSRLTREEIDERFEALRADDPVRALPSLPSRHSLLTAGAGEVTEWAPPHGFRLADRHRQPHRQDLRAADRGRHGARRWTCARSKSTRTNSG